MTNDSTVNLDKFGTYGTISKYLSFTGVDPKKKIKRIRIMRGIFTGILLSISLASLLYDFSFSKFNYLIHASIFTYGILLALFSLAYFNKSIYLFEKVSITNNYELRELPLLLSEQSKTYLNSISKNRSIYGVDIEIVGIIEEYQFI